MSLKDLLDQMNEKLYYTKVIDISGIEVELRLLSILEEQKLSSEVERSEGFDNLSILNEIRKMTLAFSIRRINGEVFPDIVEVQKGEKVEKKTRYLFLMELLAGLPTHAVSILFEAYADLKEESEEKFKNSYKYEWFKTPEEREKERQERILEADKLQQEEDSTEASEGSDEEESVPDVKLKVLPKDDIPDEPEIEK